MACGNFLNRGCSWQVRATGVFHGRLHCKENWYGNRGVLESPGLREGGWCREPSPDLVVWLFLYLAISIVIHKIREHWYIVSISDFDEHQISYYSAIVR